MSDDITLEIVPVVQIDAIWPLVSKGLQTACDKSDQDQDEQLNAGDLWQLCRSGNAFLLVGYEPETFDIKVASVWRFEGKPTVFRCLMLYGPGMKLWFRPIIKYAGEIAKENGAVSLVSEGRRGWQRYFEPSENYDLDVKL